MRAVCPERCIPVALQHPRRHVLQAFAFPSQVTGKYLFMAQYVYTMHRLCKVVPPKREILKNISLSFFPGAKIGVLGLNGSGKSTLLRIMAGVDTEFDGEARPMPGLNVGDRKSVV